MNAAVGLPEVVITSSLPTKSRFSGSRVNTMSTGENTEREIANPINSPEEVQQTPINTYIENNKYTGPKHYRREFVTDNTGVQVPTYFSGTDPENLKRIRDYALVNRGPYYRAQQIFDKIDRGELKKQGGTINKFQRGTQGSGITRADLPTTSK